MQVFHHLHGIAFFPQEHQIVGGPTVCGYKQFQNECDYVRTPRGIISVNTYS